MRITDRNAIRIALYIALDSERAMLDAYRDPCTNKIDETAPGVIIARKNITAFERVLDISRIDQYFLPPSLQRFSSL